MRTTKIYSVLGIAVCGVFMAAGSIGSSAFDVGSAKGNIDADEPISFSIDGRNGTTTTRTTMSTTTTTTTTAGQHI